MSTEDDLAKLTAKMMRRKMYAILSHGTGADIKPHLTTHLAYMIELERRGMLFASGPFTGGRMGDGLTILNVDSEQEARQIAESDPFAIAGVRTFEIREWTLMEGSIGLTVRISESSARIV